MQRAAAIIGSAIFLVIAPGTLAVYGVQTKGYVAELHRRTLRATCRAPDRAIIDRSAISSAPVPAASKIARRGSCRV